ncbi:acyl-CoA dehydrogenase family protein [Streptomyces lasiicapitis]|uniref:acyl-CoA dehydrogenase family protein n=1 Tax=Streptomyces lasiicapitis TaxID=1923961 RepID=UPI0036612327
MTLLTLHKDTDQRPGKPRNCSPHPLPGNPPPGHTDKAGKSGQAGRAGKTPRPETAGQTPPAGTAAQPRAAGAGAKTPPPADTAQAPAGGETGTALPAPTAAETLPDGEAATAPAPTAAGQAPRSATHSKTPPPGENRQTSLPGDTATGPPATTARAATAATAAGAAGGVRQAPPEAEAAQVPPAGTMPLPLRLPLPGQAGPAAAGSNTPPPANTGQSARSGQAARPAEAATPRPAGAVGTALAPETAGRALLPQAGDQAPPPRNTAAAPPALETGTAQPAPAAATLPGADGKTLLPQAGAAALLPQAGSDTSPPPDTGQAPLPPDTGTASLPREPGTASLPGEPGAAQPAGTAANTLPAGAIRRTLLPAVDTGTAAPPPGTGTAAPARGSGAAQPAGTTAQTLPPRASGQTPPAGNAGTFLQAKTAQQTQTLTAGQTRQARPPAETAAPNQAPPPYADGTTLPPSAEETGEAGQDGQVPPGGADAMADVAGELSALLFTSTSTSTSTGARTAGTAAVPDSDSDGDRADGEGGEAGSEGDGHARWRALISRPEFRYVPDLSHAERTALSYRRLRLVNQAADPAQLARDPGRLAALHEWTGFIDGGLCTLTSIHYNLFLGSLIDHQDPQAPRDLSDYTALRSTGTFLCTELDHGNDAAALKTTAHHDPETGGFILNTPTPGAAKFMPNTSTTGGPKTGVVAARLIAGGKDHGIFLFLTPLSDTHGHLPGITVRPLPASNGPAVDHCLTTFDNVPLPRTALLEADHGRLTDQGTLTSTLGNPRKRFLHSINRVTTGKLCMSAGCLGMARAALAIATAHAHTRHTSGPRRGQRIPLAHHRTHHGRLLEKIATAYALTFLHRNVLAQWKNHTEENRTETERLIAITKGWITWQARDITTESRERCGAQGLFPHNGITDLTHNIEGGITAEGDNLVIWTKAAAEMILNHPTPTPPPPPTPHPNHPHHPDNYETNQPTNPDPPTHPTPPAHTNPAHTDPAHTDPAGTDPAQHSLTDLNFLYTLLTHTETLWHTRARTALRQGPTHNPLARWNHAAPHALNMITAHAQRQTAHAFLTTLTHTTHQPTKTLLTHLAHLYLLTQLTPHTGDLLALGHLTPHHIHTLPTTHNHTIQTLHPHMQTLTHAFNLPHPYLTHNPLTQP